ncbi:MAG: hypothetical protein JSR73_10670 [Proteobacteria bacterium]|nr:hypothetical protein [Pseudomonadota bacterium]
MSKAEEIAASPEARYEVGYVCKKLGLTRTAVYALCLRAGVTPNRSSAGRRLFSSAHVESLIEYRRVNPERPGRKPKAKPAP